MPCSVLRVFSVSAVEVPLCNAVVCRRAGRLLPLGLPVAFLLARVDTSELKDSPAVTCRMCLSCQNPLHRHRPAAPVHIPVLQWLKGKKHAVHAVSQDCMPGPLQIYRFPPIVNILLLICLASLLQQNRTAVK